MGSDAAFSCGCQAGIALAVLGFLRIRGEYLDHSFDPA